MKISNILLLLVSSTVWCNIKLEEVEKVEKVEFEKRPLEYLKVNFENENTPLTFFVLEKENCYNSKRFFKDIKKALKIEHVLDSVYRPIRVICDE